MIAFLTVLYGLSFIGGMFMSWVWGKLAIRALRATLPEGQKQPDTFSLIAIGLFIGAMANVALFGTRTLVSLYQGIDDGISQQPFITVVIFAMMLLILSKAILMWAADLTHRSFGSRAFAATSALWIILAPIWMLWGRI